MNYQKKNKTFYLKIVYLKDYPETNNFNWDRISSENRKVNKNYLQHAKKYNISYKKYKLGHALTYNTGWN